MLKNANYTYRPDIDGLRAVAVLAVVAFHAFPSGFPGGFIGVDVFFVISGFLISGIILDGLKRGTFSFKDFYFRRVRRICPALAIVLFATVLIGWLILLTDEYELLLKDLLSGAFFVANFTAWTETGYFGREAAVRPLLHLWSLGIEEQFYIFWPLALASAWLLGKRALAGIAIVGVGSFLLNILLIGDDPAATFFLPFTRFWELMLGAALAARGAMTLPPKARELCSLLGLALIACAALLFSSAQPFPGWRAILPTGGAALVIAAGTEAWGNRHLLSNRLAVFIGLISYPLYLWHWPLLSFARIADFESSPNGQRLIKTILVAVSIVLAFATHRFLEIRVRSSQVSQYVFSLSASLLGVCLLAIVFNLPFARLNAATNLFARDTTQLYTAACLKKYGVTKNLPLLKKPFCVESNSEKPVNVLVIGDSHANHWVPGIVVSAPDVSVLNIGSGGCPYFENVDVTSSTGNWAEQQVCRKAMTAAFKILRDTASIDTVILSSRATVQIPGPPYGNLVSTITTRFRSVLDGDRPNREIFSAALRRTLNTITKLGKRAVIVLEVPELGFRPQSCVRLRWIDDYRPIREQCRVARDLVERRQQPYRTIVKAVTAGFPGVVILDPLDVFCDEAWCYAIKNGIMLYRDHNHLSVPGSDYVWRQMTQARPFVLTH